MHSCNSRVGGISFVFNFNYAFLKLCLFPLCPSFAPFWALPLHFSQCQGEELARGHLAEAGLCALAVLGSRVPAESASHHPSAGMNVSGKMGPHSGWCDVFAFSEELAGWKLGFGWRGPLNLALAEGNNKVTDFIYLYAVCVASCAPYTTRPKSWHCDLAL